MLALHKIINLIGGWTYKTKHHLDKDSDIINSNKYSSKLIIKIYIKFKILNFLHHQIAHHQY